MLKKKIKSHNIITKLFKNFLFILIFIIISLNIFNLVFFYNEFIPFVVTLYKQKNLLKFGRSEVKWILIKKLKIILSKILNLKKNRYIKIT